jgi:hypothetical protein
MLQRADDLLDRLGGDAGIKRRGIELGVPEQHLDHSDIDVLLEQVGGEAVPQGVERYALVDLGPMGCGMTGAIELARRHRLHAVAPWKQPAPRSCRPPPGAQQFEQVWRQHHIAVFAAFVRLCHSRMLFVRAYPRETQEMVFDAHDRAFALFKGTCGRGIYDNMKTAVETIFVGKGRLYNRRFMQMCSHYLVDPVACTPASGWEKGQVENQVGLVRERFFTPRLRFKTLDELNAWLLDKCIAYAKAHRHPELPEQTVWEVFEAERPKLVPYAGRFDGFHAVPASVSKTCLVRFDNNKYSVTASAVGRPVEVHAYADRIVIRQDGRIVAEHPRSFGRGDTTYDPWHYVPVLARKPGALRNGAPFKDWVLPAAIERVRRKLAGADDGNRQMVDILNAVLTDGLPAVEAACAEAIAHGVHSADVVLNILARQRDPAPPANILTPAALTLRHAPIADCARYDNLRRTI